MVTPNDTIYSDKEDFEGVAQDFNDAQQLDAIARGSDECASALNANGNHRNFEAPSDSGQVGTRPVS